MRTIASISTSFHFLGRGERCSPECDQVATQVPSYGMCHGALLGDHRRPCGAPARHGAGRSPGIPDRDTAGRWRSAIARTALDADEVVAYSNRGGSEPKGGGAVAGGGSGGRFTENRRSPRRPPPSRPTAADACAEKPALDAVETIVRRRNRRPGRIPVVPAPARQWTSPASWVHSSRRGSPSARRAITRSVYGSRLLAFRHRIANFRGGCE